MSSARPRVEGGYFDMPRYLFDAILVAPGLSGAYLKIVLAIVRLTWGYFPEKHRGGALIRYEYLAGNTGLSKRTVAKMTPSLIREGMVEQVAPATGRRPAVLRVNPDPTHWGRFAPVECADCRTLAVECDERSTQGAEARKGCDERGTRGTPHGAPWVRQSGHSTDSLSPSFLNPSSNSPSAPPTPRDAEGRVVGGSQTDLADAVGGITTPRLKELTSRFLKRIDDPLRAHDAHAAAETGDAAATMVPEDASDLGEVKCTR